MAGEHPKRRRRADAERSRSAILEAAIHVLGERPDASIDDIATAAGLSRQTVYTHFASRESLLSAVLDLATEEVMTAFDAIELDEGPPASALVRLLDTSWQALTRYPFLVHVPAQPPAEDRQRHLPISEHLQRLIRRGQAAKEFHSSQTAPWLAAAIIALGHAAGEQVAAGHMTIDEATGALRHSVLRLVGGPTAAGR